MAEQREGMITVRSDLHDYMEQIDQYTAQLPLTIREQMRQAREYLEKAMEADPDDQNTVISLGQACHALKDYKKAAELLGGIFPPKDYHPFYYTVYAESLESLGQREKARDMYHKEITIWEESRVIRSVEILDGCFVRTLYLDAILGAMELTVDMGVYKRFLAAVTMDAAMQRKLAQNISYLSTALTVRTFRIPFRSLVREIEEQGYLLDSEHYPIIENAYRSVESYEYHEDNAVSAMMESFLSAESRAPMAGDKEADNNDRLTVLSYEWYMTRYIENHGEELLYVSEKYPHTYIRAVTYLDQLQTLGAEGMRNAILDKLETFDEALEAGMEEAYQKALKRKKEPVYLTEGNVTYKRSGKKILPNDPCPCGSGKKYKKCHGRK